jgi:peptide/nickel transport system permease protein
MMRFIFRRLLLAVLVSLVASFASFALIIGSRDTAAAIAGESASRADIEAIRVRMGLDRPLVVQYGDWLNHAAHGDFGTSALYNLPVLPIVLSHLKATFLIGLSAIVLALGISVPLGCLAAIRQGGWLDRIAMGITVGIQAMPGFWVALLLIYIFAVILKVLPAATTDDASSYLLPIVAVTIVALPPLIRMMKAGMVETLSADYMRTAASKGLSRRRQILVHAMPNAIAPLLGLMSVQFGAILAGSVVIEVVFSVKGIGYLTWYSITTSDFAVAQTVVMMISVIFSAITLLMDILLYWANPRLRHQ